jgi:hypothetical protein
MFTYDVPDTDVALFVEVNETPGGRLDFFPQAPSQEGDMRWSGGPPGAIAAYYDVDPANGFIGTDDYIMLSGLTPGTRYTFEMYHYPTDQLITMAGSPGTFVTPVG